MLAVQERLSLWLPIKQIKPIFFALSNYGESRLVGGVVRDLLLLLNNIYGHIDHTTYTLDVLDDHGPLPTQHKDVDISTTIPPEKVMKILNDTGIKCIPTGIKYGTVSAIIEGKEYQITTLRKDKNCDGRHAEVSYGTSWEEDAQRRDFTVNSLYMDLEGNIYDYTGGMSDIKFQRLRFVGNPTERIREDYLRILRYFRFQALLDFEEIDEESLNSCISLAHNLHSISGERIEQEMKKLLIAKSASRTLQIMYDGSVLHHISINLPENNVIIPRSLSTENHIVTLAILLRSNNVEKSMIEEIRNRWKMSGADYRLLSYLCFPSMETKLDDPEKTHRKAMYIIGRKTYELYIYMLHIEEKSVEVMDKPMLDLFDKFEKPKVPITLQDFCKDNVTKEEAVKVLREKIDLWIESDFTFSREKLLEGFEKHT